MSDAPADPGPFEEEAVLAEARARTGLADFGDDAFREPLRRLLASLDREAHLHARGRASLRGRIVDSLVTRLVTEAAIAETPAILEHEIAEPVVIVGLARTGSTRLHRLLATGPRFQAARWWEVRHPAPFPGSDWRREDPRIPAAREEVRLTLEAVPVLASVHPWDAEGADEEIMLLEHAFMSHVPESGADVPSYRRWLDEQDLRPAYRFLDRLLRYIAWQKEQAGRGGGRWILKAPFHLGYLDVLIETFPGARILHSHRDPVETIPSAASMYRALWALNRDEVDDARVGRQVAARYRWALERAMRLRETLANDACLDLHYEAVQEDPLAAAHRVYAWLGLEPAPEDDAAMRSWLAANSRDARPAHRYGLAEFGFGAEQLAADFAPYRARFGL